MSTLEGKKKKIGEPLEHCLPPHLPLLWILICVQEMGDKLLINNGVAFTHKVSFLVLIWYAKSLSGKKQKRKV